MGLRLRLLRFLLREFVKPGATQDASPAAQRERVERVLGLLAAPSGFATERRPLAAAAEGGRPALEWVAETEGEDRRGQGALLYFSGGGYVYAAVNARKAMLRALARALPLRIAALDCRLPPEHPFPAAFDDALAAWETIRAEGVPAGRIALAGDSAGGGLALALTAALCARGEPPAAVVAFSPWTDLALTSGALHRNALREAALSRAWLKAAANRYLDGADPRDPRASPLYARFERPPPILIQVGSTEALKDDSLRMVEALRLAGGDVRLELLREAPHMVQLFEAVVPEGAAAVRSACAFLLDHIGAARAGMEETRPSRQRSDREAS